MHLAPRSKPVCLLDSESSNEARRAKLYVGSIVLHQSTIRRHSQSESAEADLRTDQLLAANEVFMFVSMSKTEILEELPKPTKTERQEIQY